MLHGRSMSKHVPGWVLLVAVSLSGYFATMSAKGNPITIDVDLSFANALIDLACSGKEINEADFQASDALRGQLDHHSSFGSDYDFESFLEGLRAISACNVPDPDPFRFAGLIKEREDMIGAIAFLNASRAELTANAVQLLSPYFPPNRSFQGDVVFVAASLSCGGFASEGSFYVDLQCIAADIESEIDATTRLIAHETYHAMQYYIAQGERPDQQIRTADHALIRFLTILVAEGTATHIGKPLEIVGEGRYASFSRSLAERHRRHMSHDFTLLEVIVDYLSNSPGDNQTKFDNAERLGFGGRYDEHLYYVGAQMSAEIEQAFGPSAIPCLVAQSPENFVLAYAQATRNADRKANLFQLADSTSSAAQQLVHSRPTRSGFEECTGAN